jgi:hypothetical protein
MDYEQDGFYNESKPRCCELGLSFNHFNSDFGVISDEFSYCQLAKNYNGEPSVGPGGGMVYTADLKSAAARLTGSSPVLGTNRIFDYNVYIKSVIGF